MKLNQTLALLKGVKNDTHATVTKTYQSLGKQPLFTGLVRTYAAIADDDTERLPAESQRVQLNAHDLITDVDKALTRLFHITGSLDAANQIATADLIIDGNVVVTKVPVTHLLFLEKQLTDIRTFIAKLPVLDPQHEWTYNADKGCYVTDARQTVRSKKVPRTVVAYPATEHHPAQVQVYHEDVPAGYWTAVSLSGALPQDKVNAMLHRVTNVLQAVKKAREEANMTAAPQFTAAAVLAYIWG